MVALGVFVALYLFVALMVAIVGAMFGVAVGFSSGLVLQALLPPLLFSDADLGHWLVLCGGLVGGLCGLFLTGRVMWADLKKMSRPRL